MSESINPYDVPAFAVCWRPYVTNGWQRLTSADDFEAAVTNAESLRQQFGGQVQIVSQSVVHAEGLGAQEFIPRAIRRAAGAIQFASEDPLA